MAKCLGCGVTLTSFEIEDKRCANCQEDLRRNLTKKSIKDTMSYLDSLQEDDFEQDTVLEEIYKELSNYFRS